MPIHVCVACDSPECRVALSVGFDSLNETYGDLAAALRGTGWSVETDGDSRGALCRCPEHAGPASHGTTTPTPDSETATGPTTTP